MTPARGCFYTLVHTFAREPKVHLALVYKHVIDFLGELPKGFIVLEVRCSIQLSYGRVLKTRCFLSFLALAAKGWHPLA